MGSRIENEISHGKLLAANDAESQWGWGTVAGKQRAERRAHIIMERAKILPEDTVLEIGCGNGMFTAMFARTRAKILAVDLSPDLLQGALARNLPSDKVKFVNSPFEDCDVSGPFDAIIGSSVLHHLDVDPSLRKMHAMLRNNGRIVFAEPNYLNPQVFIERTFRRYFPYVSPDETAFCRFFLARKLILAGFANISITPFDWLHPAVPAPLVHVIGRLGLILEKIPVLREFSGSLCISARKRS